MKIPKLTQEQARSFALLITPYIRGYIRDHPDKYTAYIKEVEKTVAEQNNIETNSKIK